MAGDKEAVRVDQDLTLAPFHPLVAIKAANAPFSVVFTDWLSMMTTAGLGVLTFCHARRTVQGAMNPRPGALDPPTPEGPPHRAPGWKVRGGSGATGSRNAADTGSRQRQPADRCGEGARASALRGGEVRAPPIGRRSGPSGCHVAPCPASFVSGRTWSRRPNRRLPTQPLSALACGSSGKNG